MKRILIVASFIPDGGISSWVASFVQMTQHNHDFMIVANEESEIIKRAPGLNKVPFRKVPLLSINKMFGISKLKLIIKEFNPDAILCQEIFVTFGVVIARKLMGLSIPIVIAAHCLIFDFSLKLKLKSRILSWILKYMLQENDIIVADSPVVYDHLKETPLKLFSIKMIPNGIDMNRNLPSPLLQDNKLKHVAFLGRLSHEKGPDRFVEVAEILRKEKVHFHLIGAGDMYSNLKVTIDKKGLSNSISIYGWVPELFPLLRSMDAVLLTSRTESLPYGILEAFLCKIPVFSLSVGGMAYLLQGGKNGILCNSVDDMASQLKLRLLVEGSSLKALSDNAYSFLETNLSIDQMVKQYLSVLLVGTYEN